MKNPLRKEQPAYQKGKSAETALAEVVTEMEKSIKCDFALTDLLDIEGAFNHTAVESICQNAREHEVSDTVIDPDRWIRRLLNSRRGSLGWKEMPTGWAPVLHNVMPSSEQATKVAQ